MTNSTDANTQRAGESGVLFFAGRLKGRNPSYDFGRLKSVAATMNEQSAQADLQQRCGPLLTSSMQGLQTALAPPASQTTPPAAPSAPKAPPKR